MPVVPGVKTVGYLTFIGAGVIAMTTLFTSLFGGTVLLFDKNWGLMRETFSSPLPRIHVIIGIGLSGMTKSFIQAAVIMVFGLLLGVEFFGGYDPVQILYSLAGIIVFVGTFSLGFLFLSAAIAITMESPEGMQAVITLLTMPFFFTSNALYPVDSFPPVLRALSTINPLTHLVNGIRYFAIGSDFSAIGIRYTYTQGEILASYIALLAFAGIMFIIARWRFSKVTVT
ncbi:ABC-2 type transporter [anaerobic digester metagenome]